MLLISYRVQEKNGFDRWLVLEQCEEPDTIAIVIETRMEDKTQTQRLFISRDDWKSITEQANPYGPPFWKGATND